MYENQSIVIEKEKKQNSKHTKIVVANSFNSDAALHILLELKQLKADGILTLDEYEEKKKRMLAI